MTEKQNAFIAEYLINGFNATQAAIVAGYSEKTARTQASVLLTNHDIRKAVQKHVDNTINAKKDILKTKIIEKYEQVAFSDDPDIKESDKLKANDMLGKFMSMFIERVEHTINTDVIDDLRSKYENK